MKIKMHSLIFPVFAASLSGVLLFLAFPKHDLGWLAWVGLVPLLAAISGKSVKSAFFLSYLCGIIFFVGVFNWVFQIPGYKFLHHAFLIPYMGLYFGLFGLAFSIISERSGIALALLATPFLWVTLEYIRANMSFLSLPWALMGHSQYQWPAIIQLVSLTGTYGLSFLIILVNAAVAAACLAFLSGFRIQRTAVSLLLGAAVMAGLTLFYGHVTLLGAREGRKEVRVSVLQGNIDQERKSDPKKYAKSIMEDYVTLSRQASKDHPELIVWPEAATPGFILKNMAVLNQVVSLIRGTGTYFLIGSSEYPKFARDKPSSQLRVGNTALFFSPEGKVLGQYLKIHLVPFGEYIPFEGIISWPRFIVPENKKSYEVQGKKWNLFAFDDAKFGVLICWEIVFPQLFRRFVKDGANFMINITNEGWFGKSAAPYQMAAISAFRAVENRVSLVRAANTGISCFIDPYGRITGRVKQNNKDIFVRGYSTREIRLSNDRTFYTIYGDIFIYVILLVTAVIIFVTFFKIKRGSQLF